MDKKGDLMMCLKSILHVVVNPLVKLMLNLQVRREELRVHIERHYT